MSPNLRSSVTERAIVPLLIAVLVAGATAFGEPLSRPLQDLCGRLAPPIALPTALVVVDSDPQAAAASALAAGAASARMALPAGHPLLDGAPPEDRALRVDEDGRVRWDGETRLPLPEALSSLLSVHADQLAPGGPRGLLTDRDVVLVFDDPALGQRIAVPGRAEPVRRGEALAVALGTARADAGLQVMPKPLAAGLCALLALGMALLSQRRLPRTLALSAPPLWLLALAAAVGARAMGWSVPIGGALLALALPPLVRILLTARRALNALDRISLRLGGAAGPRDSRPPLEQLVDAAALHAPGHTVVAWRSTDAWRLEEAARVAGPSEVIAPETAPARTTAGSGQLTTPIIDSGEVVGAIAIAGPAATSPETRPWLEALAQLRPGVGLRYEAAENDPFDARLQLAYRGVVNAVSRARARELLEREEKTVLGVFNLAGTLVVGTGALRALTSRAAGLPLLTALEALCNVPPEVLRQIVRDRTSTAKPLRVRSTTPGQDVLITPLIEYGEPVAVMVQQVESGRTTQDTRPAKVMVMAAPRARRSSSG